MYYLGIAEKILWKNVTFSLYYSTKILYKLQGIALYAVIFHSANDVIPFRKTIFPQSHQFFSKLLNPPSRE